jgi:hypothetical protein
MSNIVGENHLPYVSEQIKLRQDILSRSSRSPQDINWENSKTGWVKLISSIDIDGEEVVRFNEETKEDEIIYDFASANQKLEQLGLTEGNYTSNRLASELVLQGGSLFNNSQRFGIAESTSTLPGIQNSSDSGAASYGMGGTEFGIKPMPGITSFKTQTFNNGSLRNANLTILAHNRVQFLYIEALYLRLGYTMLVEWGNTSFPIKIEENGETTYNSIQDLTSLQSQFLNSQGKDSNYFYTEIENLREKSKGNYDAFLGVVDQFDWEFTKEGSYVINIRLVSKGSVIESLKSNTNLDNINYPLLPFNSTINLSSFPTIYNTNDIRPSSLDVYLDLCANIEFEGAIMIGSGSTIYDNTHLSNTNTVKEWFNEDQKSALGNYSPTGNISCKVFYGDEGDEKSIAYIRFGEFLNFINQKLLLYNDRGFNEFIEIDLSPETYCYSNTWSFPSDPSKALISFKKTLEENNTIQILESLLPPFHDTVENVKVGRVFNIYFSISYLKDLIQTNIDDFGSISVYNIINQLLTETNDLLGGVNKLKSRIANKRVDNQVKQVLEIYDEVQPFGKEALLNNKEQNPILNLYGVGGFVTDYSFKTEIDKDYSTIISIGAQASGRVVGEDSTIFSQWSKGLVDRIKPRILDSNQVNIISKQNASDRVDFITLSNQYISYLALLLGSGFKSIPAGTAESQQEISIYNIPGVNLNAVEGEKVFSNFGKIQKDFFKASISYDALSKNSATPFLGFIPAKLQLTLDGLSGIKIFDKLRINSKFLPPNYGDNLEFIITELDHSIQNNKWYTQIGTLGLPKYNKEPEVRLIGKVNQSDDAITRTVTDSLSIPSYFWSDNPPVVSSNFLTAGATSSGRVVTEDEILATLNQSPEVQFKFQQFLFNLIGENGLLPNGYEIRINSTYRNFERSYREYSKTISSPLTIYSKTIKSPHFWGLAIDIALYEPTGTPGESTNKIASFGSDYLDVWESLGLPDYAKQYDLRWGGYFRKADGSIYPDGVHFDVLNTNDYTWYNYIANEAEDFINTTYPGLKSIYLKSTRGNGLENATNLPYWFSDILDARSTLTIGEGRVKFDSAKAGYFSSRASSFQQNTNYTPYIIDIPGKR